MIDQDEKKGGSVIRRRFSFSPQGFDRFTRKEGGGKEMDSPRGPPLPSCKICGKYKGGI